MNMKLSTKVEIANQLAKANGGRPVMTMNELHAALEPIKAKSREEMRKKIEAKLFS